MSGLTEEQVEEIVQEAVAKTEKSFGGTFKRLKSENEELKQNYETTTVEYESAKEEMKQRVSELESKLAESKKRIRSSKQAGLKIMTKYCQSFCRLCCSRRETNQLRLDDVNHLRKFGGRHV